MLLDGEMQYALIFLCFFNAARFTRLPPPRFRRWLMAMRAEMLRRFAAEATIISMQVKRCRSYEYAAGRAALK